MLCEVYLRSPQARTLNEYNMKIPISRATTWRWMQTVGIFRDKYKQSYYNDKHQDATVIEDRAHYIQVMDKLMIRQPLWLQLPMHEFWCLKARMPSDGLLVHHYTEEGSPMVELHVDLDDSFDARRAALPLGGCFSVRFPARPAPTACSLREPPNELPAPGAGLALADGKAHSAQDNVSASVPSAPASALAAANTDGNTQPQHSLPSVAMINQMKVIELKGHLQALGLRVNGNKPELCARLLAAVNERIGGALDATAEARSESDENEEEWKVKKILSRRVCTTLVDESLTFDVVEYEVQWDWPDPDDPSKDEVTWEIESNLTNAVGALHDFFAAQPKQPGCDYGHIQGVCRCALPLIHTGQDESIFKAYQKSSYQWVVQGVRGLRKKTDGPGEMVSGFKDEIRGFGHPLSQDELKLVNAFRKARRRAPLTSSPCVRFLSYGKNKDGYWTYDHFSEQVQDVLDMYEALYPNAQVLSMELHGMIQSISHGLHSRVLRCSSKLIGRPGTLNIETMLFTSLQWVSILVGSSQYHTPRRWSKVAWVRVLCSKKATSNTFTSDRPRSGATMEPLTVCRILRPSTSRKCRQHSMWA